MTTALPDFNRPSRLRPYWLLLVLALFFAGQVASSAHRHEAINQFDADCALCMLSSASGSGAVGSSWQFLTTPLSGIAILLLVTPVRRTTLRFYESRAPPVILSSSV